jgi:NitT/TauT family transport system substrate-binding protein
MTMKSGIRGFVFALSFAAATLAVPPPVRAADKPTVTLGLVAYLSEYWPALIAHKLGYFTDAGIDVDIVITGASSKTVQTASVGAVHIGASGMIDPVRAMAAGAQVKLVASGVVNSTTMLFARPEIKTVGALKGKRVIVGGAKDITAVWWAAMARKAGLDPLQDVELLFAGATPDRFAALVAGGVDAAALSTPAAFAAKAKGFTNLGLLGPYMPDLPYIAYYANAPWAKDNRPALVAFVKGLQRGTAFIYDSKNRDEAAKILAELTKQPQDVALQTYDLIVRINAFAPDAGFTDAGINAAQKVLIDAGEMKPPIKPVGEFYDDSFVKEAAAGK